MSLPGQTQLAEAGVLVRPTLKGIQVTIPEMVLLEVKLSELGQSATGRNVEMEIEWRDEDRASGYRSRERP